MIFCDVTIREGEMTPGVSYTDEEKCEIAGKLDSLGIQQIQLSVPGLDPQILRLNRRICSSGLKARTEVMVNGRGMEWELLKKHVEAAADCGPDILHCSFKVGNFSMPEWTETSKEMLYETIARTADCMKKTGKLVNISFTDAVRADHEFLCRCMETAAKNGADRIRLADSYGVATPEFMEKLVRDAVETVRPYGAIVGIHTHDDFGLALANALAGIRAGARLVDVSINGLGDRAGNVRLAEILVVLEALYKQETGMRLEQITELSRYMERISGVKIPAAMPLVGENVFAEEMAGHAIEQFTCKTEGRGLVPADIGGELSVIYGKYTNEKVIGLTAKRAGREIPKSLYPKILKKLEEESEKHKGVSIREDGFWEIVESLA